MKERHGFVSNSSSSSFICEICGKEGEAFDPSEVGMVECIAGHVFCKEHAINKDMGTSYDSYNEDRRIRVKNFDDLHDDKWIPSLYCPLCEDASYEYFTSAIPEGSLFTEQDILKYMLKMNKTTEKKMLKVMEERFPTHIAFREFIGK